MNKSKKSHTEQYSSDIPLGKEFDFVITFRSREIIIPNVAEELKAQFEVPRYFVKKKKVKKSMKDIEIRLKRCEEITNREVLQTKLYFIPPRKVYNDEFSLKNFISEFNNQMNEKISSPILMRKSLSEFKKNKIKKKIHIPSGLRQSRSKRSRATKTLNFKYCDCSYFEHDSDMFYPTISQNRTTDKRLSSTYSHPDEAKRSIEF